MLLKFGFYNTFLVWQKQTSVAINTIEVGYMVASAMSREAIWLRKLLAGLFGQNPGPIVTHCDNQSCIQMTVNIVFHDKTKHIEI